MPRTIEPELDAAYAIRGVADQQGRYLVPVRGAHLVGARGMVRLPDGSIASESVNFEPPLARDRNYLKPPCRRFVEKPGRYFSLVIHWSGTRNYYHWFHDVLTRLDGVLDVVPADTTLIVPPNMRGFQKDSLRLMGIPEKRLVEYDGRETWTVETLYFAPRVSHVGADRGETDRWVRDRVLRGCGITPRSTGRRIFISRRNAGQRRLVNDDEVSELLERYGFETVVTEGLSLESQAMLFAQAAVLVSTHGAGLTNMLFSAPGLKVLEMIEPAKMEVSYIYWAMAEELGHEYWYFVADTVSRPGHQSDTSVSLEKLEATLLAMKLDQ
jgi:capsular polysaccharide biosynthesis protein